MQFANIKNNANIYLYAGNLRPLESRKPQPFVGLSLTRCNEDHIKHDITRLMPLYDDSVDIYQSEDVMEHVEYDILPSIINEIYRVLKPGGLFRLSMPDYRCDVLLARSQKDEQGNIVFDKGGGGRFVKRKGGFKVINGGHLWFPKYESVEQLLKNTKFSVEDIHFLHYYSPSGDGVCNPIDYSLGYVFRTPDHDQRIMNPRRPMSIVVDCYKKSEKINDNL